MGRSGWVCRVIAQERSVWALSSEANILSLLHRAHEPSVGSRMGLGHHLVPWRVPSSDC